MFIQIHPKHALSYHGAHQPLTLSETVYIDCNSIVSMEELKDEKQWLLTLSSGEAFCIDLDEFLKYRLL